MFRFAITILSLGLGSAAAAPLWFTFTGTITLIPTDRGGYAADHNYTVGMHVAYIFEVDTARIGYTLFDGSKVEKPDITNPGYQANNFFDSLISEPLFQGGVGATAAGSFFGYHTISSVGTTERVSAMFQSQVGEPDKQTHVSISLPGATPDVFLPVVGAKLTATESYTSGTTDFSGVSMSLTLTGISATKPFTGVRRASGRSESFTLRSEGSTLLLLNGSGAPARLRIQDGIGHRIRSVTLGDRLSLPLADLPHGLSVITASQAGGAGTRRWTVLR